MVTKCLPTFMPVYSQLDVKNVLNLVSKILLLGDDRKEPKTSHRVFLKVNMNMFAWSDGIFPFFRLIYKSPFFMHSLLCIYNIYIYFLTKTERLDFWDSCQLAVKALRKGKTSNCLSTNFSLKAWLVCLPPCPAVKQQHECIQTSVLIKIYLFFPFT